MKYLFLLFFLVPLIEIYFLIQIGSVLGAGTTVILVVFTAVLGAYLVRHQGFSTLIKMQNVMAQGRIPAMEVIEGMTLFIAGALLLTPGFFTDTIGFVLLIPTLRKSIIEKILLSQQMRHYQATASTCFSDPENHRTTRIIEGRDRD